MTAAMPTSRTSAHAIDRDILHRWSPRAFDGSVLDEASLLALLEAARWAPSAYNYQPWRFVYALRDTPEWERLLSALLPFNAVWANTASALLFILSDRLITPPGKTDATPATTASFDTGAAWGFIALQAAKHGLHAHAMAGFDHGRAAEVLGAGERFQIEAAVAIGRMGDPAQLPDALRAREVPSSRHPLQDIAFLGHLPAPAILPPGT